MIDWQPIETAPRDGTWILLKGGAIDYGWCSDSLPPAVVGQCVFAPQTGKVTPVWQFAWYDGGYYGEYESPTHWAPLLVEQHQT